MSRGLDKEATYLCQLSRCQEGSICCRVSAVARWKISLGEARHRYTKLDEAGRILCRAVALTGTGWLNLWKFEGYVQRVYSTPAVTTSVCISEVIGNVPRALTGCTVLAFDELC
jgi:hypothetical protein